MTLSKEDLKELCKVAIDAARKAGNYISSYNREEINIQLKNMTDNTGPCGGTSIASQVVTEVDINSQEIILQILNPTSEKYNLGLLTEEIVDDNSRFDKDYFWCIDPLDGTLPFTQGKEGYSVSIALVAKNGTPVIGIVYNPITHDIYHAIIEQGSYKNGEKWCINQKNESVFTFINDRSFYKHPKYKSIVTSLNMDLSKSGFSAFKMIKQGGAVMNAIWVIEKAPACYLKLPKKEKGGGSIWDFAATSCIFNELGLHASDFEENPLNLNNNSTTFMNEKGILFSSLPKINKLLKSYGN